MKRHGLAKFLLTGASLLIMLAATVGTAAAAPQSQSGDQQSGLFGKVVSVTENGFVVEPSKGMLRSRSLLRPNIVRLSRTIPR